MPFVVTSCAFEVYTQSKRIMISRLISPAHQLGNAHAQFAEGLNFNFRCSCTYLQMVTRLSDSP